MTAPAAKPRTGTPRPKPMNKGAKPAAKAQKAPKEKPERPAAKSLAEQLRDAEAAYLKKYPKRQIQPGSIRQESDGAHAGKRTVVIICENAQCGKKRRVATSDLHQVRHCADCTEKIRAARRRKSRPATNKDKSAARAQKQPKAVAAKKPTPKAVAAKKNAKPKAGDDNGTMETAEVQAGTTAEVQAGANDRAEGSDTVVNEAHTVQETNQTVAAGGEGGTVVVETHTVRQETHSKEVHTGGHDEPGGQGASQPAHAGSFAGTLDDRLKGIE